MLNKMEAGTKLVAGFFIILIFRLWSVTALESIMGRRESCTNEGEIVPVNTINIKDMTCFKCICQNGFVECAPPENCPSVDDCYMLEKKEGCCEKCKDCVYKGIMYPSGAEWTDPDDPCASLKCLAGVVTETNLQCYTPCNSPLPPRPGQCCPTCLGCYLNGQTVHDGREVTLSEDPCLRCSCSNKRLTCVKKACPILQCPLSKQIKTPGECCPRCKDKRYITHFPGNCILGNGFHSDGKKFSPDQCSICKCVNGTSICRRNTCPVLECAPEFQKNRPGDCCPHCPAIAEVRSTCTHNGTTYQNNDTWNLDSCRSCRCHSGEIRCAQTKCPKPKCRANEVLVTPTDQCCARCEETAGVCTLFGSHYKTFDGKFFNFHGSCKYQLTADCYNHTFSIRITNDGRKTKTSSWTKTVTLKFGAVKVNLGHNLRVKVNGTKINFPYKMPSVLDIDKTKDGVTVVTNIGIQLYWDRNNLLQVQVPALYKNGLCGLCGNYNNVYRDDLISRRGINYSDDEVWRFANSWKVGGNKACSRKNDNLAKYPVCRHKKSWLMCKSLKDLDLFEICGNRLNPQNYFESCKQDMCDCPNNGKCYCDSFSAYAHECARLGVKLPNNWRNNTGCDIAESATTTTAISTTTTAIVVANKQPGLKRHRKRIKQPNNFFSKHVPKTFLVHKHHGRTPPPIH